MVTELMDRLRMISEFSVPEKIVFGVDAVKRVGTEARRFNTGKKCLIITDPGVGRTDIIEKVRDPLMTEGFSVEIYDKILTEPTLRSVGETANYARGMKVDIVVGVGGGSSLDTAKAVGRAITNPGDLKKFLPIQEHPQDWSAPSVPVIGIPTTAGTGAELTKEAVIIIPEEKVKAWFDYCRPRVAIIDPLLSSGMPQRLTATTGLDALCHAVESALSRLAFPVTEALSLTSVRLAASNLRRATFQGDNLEARYNMALATMMEAFSDANCGLVEGHACGFVTGPFYKISHGVACGVALPYVMEHNLPVSVDMLATIAEAMGEETLGLSKREAAYKGILATRRLIQDIGLPTTLKEIEGASRSDIPQLVTIFMTNPWVKAAAAMVKRVVTKESITQLFEKQFDGTLGNP